MMDKLPRASAAEAVRALEKDVKYCHRGVIAQRLRESGVEVIDL